MHFEMYQKLIIWGIEPTHISTSQPLRNTDIENNYFGKGYGGKRKASRAEVKARKGIGDDEAMRWRVIEYYNSIIRDMRL